MNFTTSSWFDAYIDYRKAHPIELEIPQWKKLGLGEAQLNRFESTRHPSYQMLQHSGLVYGFPIQYPFAPDLDDQMKSVRRVKITLLDILLYTVFLEKEEQFDNHRDIPAIAALIRAYYFAIGKYMGKAIEENSLEKILLDRVVFKKNFWDFRKSGINSYLFWDWYFFREFIRSASSSVPTVNPEDLITRKRKMKMLTIQIMSAAIHSDERVRKGEKVLQNHFKQSARLLSGAERAQAKRIMREGVSLDTIHIPTDLDWIARRYFLDISVLGVHADKEIVPEEMDFLNRLCDRLQLSEADLIESKADLSCFLLQFGKTLNFYNSRKSSLALLGQALGDNVEKLKYATNMEYRETKEMATTFGLLLKSRMNKTDPQELPSEEEIAYALEQLKDMPKFLPFFSLFFIPVPGITELYIVLAYSLERWSGDKVKLLPSQFRKIVKKK